MEKAREIKGTEEEKDCGEKGMEIRGLRYWL